MWQDQKKTSTSPLDCAVCGAYVYGSNSGIRTCFLCKSFFRRHAFLPSETLKCNENGTCNIEVTRRYFSSSLPPCRACRLQKCLAIGMDQNLLHPHFTTSSPLIMGDKGFKNILTKTSSLDENTKGLISEMDAKMNVDDIMFGRVRCLSDANDRHRQF